MRFRGWHAVLIFVIMVAALLLLFNGTVDAQCSMCRAALNSSSNTRFIRNFNLAVLVLLVPPVSIFCSIFLVLRKYRGGN